MSEEIRFDKRNYRKHSKKNKALIKKSLEELGAGRSVVIDREGELIAGNGVYEQAKALGMQVRVVETDGSELVVVKRTDLATEDEKRRKHGVRYILVLDDDYIVTEYINDRNRGTFPYIDVWAQHAVEFLKKHPQIGATCAINNGQLMSNSRSAYFTNLRKRQLMNTIIFDTTKEQHFESLGNGDYVTQAIMNTGSRDMIVRLQTISLRMETIKQKKHETIDYAGMFYKRWALKMAAPAYADVRILKGGQKGNILTTRFNSVWHSNSAPKIINLE